MATEEEKKPATETDEVRDEKNEDKTDGKPSTSEEETISAVVERLQFFFSDANVRQDSFLRRLLLSPEKSVPIFQLLKFNTIKQHTTDPAMIKKAAERISDVLTVRGDAICRVHDFTKDLMDKNLPVSLLVGNLPVEEKEGRASYAATVDQIKELFVGYGPITLIKLRYGFSKESDHDLLGSPSGKKQNKGPRIPIGSALVEFENLETFEKAAEETLTSKGNVPVEPKRTLTIGDHQLTVVPLKEYVEASKKRKRENPEEENGEREDRKEGPKFEIDWKPGCVIKLEGLSDACDRERLLEAVAKGMDKDVEEVKAMKIYVDYSRGQKDGCIRFSEPEQVAELLNQLKSGDFEVAGAKVEKATLLEGDDEKQYWSDFIQFKTRQIRQREEEKKNKGRRKKFHRRH